MASKKFAVLDIGSDFITLVLQDDKYANNFIFNSSAEYSGFQDGEFFDIPELFKAVDGLIKECVKTTSFKVESILVGVPGEFTTVVCKNVQTSFQNPKRVSSKDIENLFLQGNTYDKHPDFKTINASPIHYLLDGGEKTINPIGKTVSSLTSYISYVLCERSFINLFDKLASSLNIRFDYTSSILAEVMFMVPPEQRDKGVILLNVGYITSTVAYAKGDGILHSVSFSLGGGNIAGDLTTCLSIPFDHAMMLVPKINLNLEPTESDKYTISVKGEAFGYNVKEVNEVAYYRVQDIAETVKQALEASPVNIPPYTGILLTGSGISTTVGAREILSSIIEGGNVRVISPPLLQFNKPHQSSLASIILVQQQQLKYKKNFFRALISRFRRKS